MVPRNDDDPQGVMPCFFPVDAAPDSRKITTKTTDTIRLPLRNAQDTRHQLFTTWAILLHFYTGNDFVTFCSTGFEEQQLHGTISGESKSWAQRDPSILRYEFRGNSPICQLRPIQLRHSSSGMRAINTGVKHSYDEDAPFDTSSTLETSAIDIWVEASQLNGVISVLLHYRFPMLSDPFSSTILSNLAHVWNFVQEPNRLVTELSIISSKNLSLLRSWNPRDLFRQNSCMHYLVEAISRACPDKHAVCAWDGSLTYGQLDACASQIAISLNDLGVQSGDYVPLIFEKSMWVVVAALGILKAGAAFVPLEPTHPRARLEDIIQMVKAKVLVSSDMWKSQCLDLVEYVCVVSETTVSPTENVQPCDRATVSATPTDPMLVLFTSGSTGKPKGMVFDHAAICTHSIAHGEVMGYHGSRILQFAAHTFDVAVMDLFTTLLFGGCICIPSEDERLTDITGAVARLRADHIFLTPSFAGLIEPSQVPSISTIIVGGEVLSQDCANRWANATNLIQVYGPAEVGICLWTRMKAEETHPRTVGYPLSNCSCWLVDPDDYNRLVPIGAVGELLVASSSLARGYLDNGAKTAQIFLSPPSWAKELGLPYQRFYRTGDLLVHNLTDFDGSFTFIGRKDHQIKLRGQRLEPAEVEQHIIACPEIAMAVVTTVNSGILAAELVAVIQLRSGDVAHLGHEPIEMITTPNDAVLKLQESLRQILPTYAVPSRFIVINNMPMVPSMKIDRPAINQWIQSLNVLPDEIMLPVDRHLNGASLLVPIETVAVEISTKVASMLPVVESQRKTLTSQDMSVHHMGLNSIQIISLSMFLHHRFKVVVPMDTLWDSRITVRQLASYVNNASSLDAQVKHEIDLRSIVEINQNRLLESLNKISTNQHPPITTKERHILLTGATGYVGSGILKNLLMNTSNILYLLVRGENSRDSLQRMEKIKVASKWWHESYTSRVHIWRGNVSDDNFGLNDNQMKALHGGPDSIFPWIDTVIHNAAHVNYYAAFSTLVGSNVKSTATLLAIAASSCCVKDVVLVTGGRPPEVRMPSLQESCTTLQEKGGYAQTKFVAEQLAICAADHELFKTKRLSILRPGYVIGAVSDGKANPNDFIWRFIACCIDTGAYNEDEAENWLFVAGVDQAADCVRHLALREEDKSDVGNLCYEQLLSGLRFRDLWKLLYEDFGYVLIGRNADVWLSDMRTTVLDVGENHCMYPLLPILERDGRNLGTRYAPDIEHELDHEVIRRNVAYLITTGMFPRPPVWMGTNV